MVRRKPWKKNLYENTDYPDNYTDKTFLEELKKNVYIKEISLNNALTGANLLTQEICSVVLFVIIFVYMYNEWIQPETAFLYSSIITSIVFILYHSFYGVGLKTAITLELKTVLIFLVFGYISSPILHTLTDTISTDTIYATSSFMMIIHLIFFDYGLSAAIVSSSLSLNAAMFGSICLASRLSSPFHAFVLLTIAVECFALFPLLRTKTSNPVSLVFISVCLSGYILYLLSTSIMILFIASLVFINVLCPVWFLKWYRFKDNIHGPWDEAVVHDTEDVNDIINAL